MESLEVIGFLGLKEIKITVAPVTVLIGQQASGKSVIAKLLYHFRSFPEMLVEQIIDGSSRAGFERAFIARFCEYFPVSSWSHDKFEIRYKNGATFIRIAKTKRNSSSAVIDLSFSHWVSEGYFSLQREWQKRGSRGAPRSAAYRHYELHRSIFRKAFRLWTGNTKAAFSNQVFVPAGRAFFAILQNNIFSFLSSANAIDPFLGRFGQHYESMKHLSYDFIHDFAAEESIKEFEGICREIVGGDYVLEKGRDFLRSADGRKINLANASSGQQEAFPLSMLLKMHALNLAFGFREDSSSAVYIEEPEAHLFPGSQKRIIELISTVFNRRGHKTSFFLTTHSPYVLSSFNNLLLAGRYQQSSDKRISMRAKKIVPPTRALAPGTVVAFSLDRDGYSQKIMSDDAGLIDTNVIDAVSNEIGREFEELINLESV